MAGAQTKGMPGMPGKGRAEAMQEVQLEMLRSEEHHLPGDWASFVVVGSGVGGRRRPVRRSSG
jgi:CHAT domain